MSLWVPPTVNRELAHKTREHTEQVLAMVHRFHGQLRYWTAELKRRDQSLEMIFAPPTAKAPGMIPGRYHVMKFVPGGGPPALFPVTGPQGEFVEPTHQVIDRLLESDLQNPAAYRARREREQEAERAKERARERDREERQEEIEERFRAAFETSVSMHRPSRGWSQNVDGSRRPTRGRGGG